MPTRNSKLGSGTGAPPWLIVESDKNLEVLEILNPKPLANPENPKRSPEIFENEEDDKKLKV